MRNTKHKGFAMIPTELLWDKNISLSAKAMYGVIKSSVPGWNFSCDGYSHVLKEGVDAIRRATTELENAGYLSRCHKRDDNGKFGPSVYRVYEEPLSETPDSKEPSSDFPISENTVDKTILEKTDIKEISNNKNNIAADQINTDRLSSDMATFEKYIRRPLRPSEIPIWENWKRHRIKSVYLKKALEDNEYRGDKMTLEHVDDTLRLWASQGLNTIKKIDNYILDNRYTNTVSLLQAKIGDDITVDAKLALTKVADLKAWRDSLQDNYADDGDRFVRDIDMCPMEVFRYLPDDILASMAYHFKKTGNKERYAAAVKAMDKEEK